MTGVKTGDQVNVTVHEGGTVVITPIVKALSANHITAVVRKTVKDYRRTLKRMA